MTFEEIFQIITKRKEQMPENSYVANVFRQGQDRIIQKVGEEAVEVVIAAKNGKRKEIIGESPDLLFHFFVMLCELNISIKDIEEELEKRRK